MLLTLIFIMNNTGNPPMSSVSLTGLRIGSTSGMACMQSIYYLTYKHIVYETNIIISYLY